MEDIEIEKLKKENDALKNRCFVISKGALCFFCPMNCKHRNTEFRYTEEDKNDRH